MSSTYSMTKTILFDSRYRDYINTPITYGPVFKFTNTPVTSSSLQRYSGTIYIRNDNLRSNMSSPVVALLRLKNAIIIPTPNETTANTIYGISIYELSSSAISSSNNVSPIFHVQIATEYNHLIGKPSTGGDFTSYYELIVPIDMQSASFRFNSMGQTLTFKPDFIDFTAHYENPLRLTILRNSSTQEAMAAHGLVTGQYINFVAFTSSTGGYENSENQSSYVHNEKLYSITRTDDAEITVPLDFSGVSGGPTKITLFIHDRRFYMPVTFGFKC